MSTAIPTHPAPREQQLLELRESEERFRLLSGRLEIILEGVTDGITVQDRSGQVVYANTAAARLCGFDSVEAFLRATPAEVTSRFEMLDEHGRPIKSEELPGRRVLSGDARASSLLHVRERATGRHWWSLIRAGAVLGPDGTPQLAVNIWHDFTAEYRAERDARYTAEVAVALASSTEPHELLTAFTRVLVPSLADWGSVYLLEGETLRNAVSLHADPAKAATAADYQRRFPPDPEKPGVWSVLRSGVPVLYNDIPDEALEKVTSHPEQLAILRSVGMTAILVVPIVLHSKVIGVISLVSAESGRRYDESQLELVEELAERAGIALERASLFRAAKAAADAAESASRAKDEFLATVSHELRTPLSAILGWSTILKDRVSDPAIAKPLQAIFRNAQAQVKIIEDILDVSRVITGKFRIEPKPADLVRIAKEAADVVRPSAVAKGVAIELDFEQETCALVADAERLQQVVWNLLSNAVKFTPAGGKVVLSVRHAESQIRLEVSDTGAGIGPAFLPFVFDRFRQGDSSTTRRVGGLGLGLSLVRHIVELHGGQVEARSEGAGKGATFSVVLPVRTESAPETISSAAGGKPAGSLFQSAVLAGRSVVVVDDEEDARDVIAAVLREAGANVETARSVAETLGILRRSSPDALVSDLAMPFEDGYSLIAKVRADPDHARLPALAVTAYARDEDRLAALRAGFDDYLGKPADPSTLVAKVAELAASRSR